MKGFLVIAIAAVALSLAFAAYNYLAVRRRSRGTDRMGELSDIIADGARTFIKSEYRIIAIAAAGITVLLSLMIAWYVGIAFLTGTIMSATAGYIGMRIATIANVRVANEARVSKSIGRTLKVAFQGGSVMGLSVAGFALLGMTAIYLVFGQAMGQLDPQNLVIFENPLGISFIPFTMTISGYALGCSVVALFNRVGGGIYTKAADMGADLVGKTEAHIPEDDPRNPATIADNVGDNVGDVAGLGSDLLESYVGAIAAAVIFVSYVFYYSVKDGLYFNEDMITSLLYFPIAFAAIGVFACILGIAFVIFKKASDKPHRELNFALWLSAALIIAGGAGLSLLTFGKYEARDFAAIGFKVGALSPWLGAVIGIVSGIAIGMFAEYFTSADYKPTRRVALSSMEGPALTITSGMALGMKSTLMPVLILAAATIGSNAVGGLFGVAMAATGMLSFVAATVSVDTYGPIADNAGGISEMCNLEPEVREITDKLDSVGNTTAAIGKGFAIGSAALAALSLLSSFMHSFHDDGNPLAPSLDIINPLTLAGCFVGAALPYLFSGMLIEAVGTSARKMVAEIRNQFHEHPGILDGTEDPDYNRCIQISATGALSEMKMPVLVAVGVPVLAGFLFGPYLVGGLLVGATASAIMLALYTANAGGAWDNGKKHIEQGGLEDAQKGDDTHAAAVIGDTVGDPLKDTVGPSLDILIKIMATVSLIAVSVFSRYNLSDAFGWFR